MKKIMIIVATVAMSLASYATLTPTECPNCGEKTPESECDVVVFKVTGSGKSVVSKGDYKTISTLKIKKGALALTGSYCATSGECCYDSGMFYATIKVGKKSFKMATEIAPTVWSVFGSNYERVRTRNCKQGKKYKLESALCIESQGDSILWDNDEVEDISFEASAFGKIIATFTKAQKAAKNVCSATATSGCDPVVKPSSYSGWFVGRCACLGEEGCFLCDCADTDVFGGTWKASYIEKITTLTGARKLANVPSTEDDDL